MNANADHKVVTPGAGTHPPLAAPAPHPSDPDPEPMVAAGGEETTAWEPSMIIDLIRSVPANTFDSALLAYSWNLFSQDGWPVRSDTMHRCS